MDAENLSLKSTASDASAGASENQVSLPNIPTHKPRKPVVIVGTIIVVLLGLFVLTSTGIISLPQETKKSTQNPTQQNTVQESVSWDQIPDQPPVSCDCQYREPCTDSKGREGTRSCRGESSSGSCIFSTACPTNCTKCDVSI